MFVLLVGGPGLQEVGPDGRFLIPTLDVRCFKSDSCPHHDMMPCWRPKGKGTAPSWTMNLLKL